MAISEFQCRTMPGSGQKVCVGGEVRRVCKPIIVFILAQAEQLELSFEVVCFFIKKKVFFFFSISFFFTIFLSFYGQEYFSDDIDTKDKSYMS